MNTMTPDEGWSLFEKFRNGDKEAFQELFRKHKRNVINLAYRFVRNQSAAEDIAQDVFIKVFEKKAVFDPKAKFTTWLYRVTANASIDWTRKKGRFDRSLDEVHADEEDVGGSLLQSLSDPKSVSPSQALVRDETSEIIRGEIGKLPENLRNSILLYQFEDLSYDEIARILGVSVKAVERRIYHAKEILRQNLPKELF